MAHIEPYKSPLGVVTYQGREFTVGAAPASRDRGDGTRRPVSYLTMSTPGYQTQTMPIEVEDMQARHLLTIVKIYWHGVTSPAGPEPLPFVDANGQQWEAGDCTGAGRSCKRVDQGDPAADGRAFTRVPRQGFYRHYMFRNAADRETTRDVLLRQLRDSRMYEV